MGEKVTFSFDEMDYDAAVDEVDILVPRYLEALEELQGVEGPEDVPSRLNNVLAYWERLSILFDQISRVESDIPFEQIILDSLQMELSVLEKVYLMLNLRIEFDESHWTETMWSASDHILSRMNEVLGRLGFPEDHEDRSLIAELIEKNKKRARNWRKKQVEAS